MNDTDTINISLTWNDFRKLLAKMDSDPIAACEILRPIIKDKLDRMIKRELYSTFKTAASAEEREQARQKYLDTVGIPSEFRW